MDIWFNQELYVFTTTIPKVAVILGNMKYILSTQKIINERKLKQEKVFMIHIATKSWTKELLERVLGQFGGEQTRQEQ